MAHLSLTQISANDIFGGQNNYFEIPAMYTSAGSTEKIFRSSRKILFAQSEIRKRNEDTIIFSVN